MQRRDFLRAGLPLGAFFGAAAAPRAWGALPTEGAAFDTAIAGQPWMRPFKGIDPRIPDRHCDALALEGRWPAQLRGRFYRNGPALMERDGRRYHHWFAGDGMVQRFTLSGGARPVVRHLGRIVRTPKFVAEQAADRFLIPAYGTKIESDAPTAGPDSFNVANTSVIEHAGRVLALWEGGSAFALRRDDLTTLGPVEWRDDLAQMPFSAHPKLDPSGHLWNIGVAGAKLVVWHVDPQGRLVKAQVGESPYPGGMAHDAAITERYIVLPLPPVKLHFGEDVAGGAAFTHEPDQPLRILVMEKADIGRRRVFELPSQMLFHVGNAHERGDGSIVLSFVAPPTPEFVLHGAAALMAGHSSTLRGSSTQLAVLDMRSGRATVESMGDAVEFPRVHPGRNGLPTRHLLSVAAWRGGGNAFHGLQLRDVATGRCVRHDFGDAEIAEEHVVVPKPGGHGELDAWLLGTTYDMARDVTRLNVFEARHLADGPIARATLPYALPYGFHGNFTAA